MPKPDYKVVCCGQSWGDLCMHFCGLMTDSFYSLFNVGFLWRKRSDSCYFVEYYFSRFRLGIVVTLFMLHCRYIYGIIGIVGLICLFSLVAYNGKNVDNRRLEELADGICFVCCTNMMQFQRLFLLRALRSSLFALRSSLFTAYRNFM